MTYNNYLGDVCEPHKLHVIMKRMMEKAKFTNIPTIN